MNKPQFTVGERVEKLCVVCNEVRGHVVVSVTKRGQISRVSCPKCGERSSYKAALSAAAAAGGGTTKSGAPYDRTRTYRTGQAMMHPTFGLGEVTKVIEPGKIDVLFADRMRRLIHSIRPE
ncbi:MAG: hypothetical protein ABR555_04735 [Pyrinomonadaceae bacterium]